MGDQRTAGAPPADDLVERMLEAAEAAGYGMRRENGHEVPLGTKAARTRDALLAAAYDVFVTQGYQATSVGDIAERAGVSLGTFYQYFRDRSDILGTLVRIGVLDVLRGGQRPWDPARGRLGLRRVIAGFVSAYASSAAFQAVWEEVTHIDENLASLRRDLSHVFTRSIAAGLADGAERGLVRGDLDPEHMAQALTAMVDRYCYMTFVFDRSEEQPISVDDAVDLLTALWADAIGLVEGAGRPSG